MRESIRGKMDLAQRRNMMEREKGVDSRRGFKKRLMEENMRMDGEKRD